MKCLYMFDCANGDHNYTQCLTVIIVNQHRCVVQEHVYPLSKFYSSTRVHVFVDLLPLTADIHLVGNAEMS
jgi:hypothetical protein